jgi:glycosyltransferase involved in cell wall biosynthesis
MTNQKNKQKITFYLPRLHNNIRPLIETLKELGFDITVLTLREGNVENHSCINYVRLNRLTIFSNKYFKSQKIRKLELPSFKQINKIIGGNKPEFMIIRNDATLSFIPALIIGKYYKCKIILYNQYPKNNPSIFQNIYNLFFYKFLHIRTITPVLNKYYTPRNNIDFESVDQYKFRLINQMQHHRHPYTPVWIPFFHNGNQKIENKLEDNILRVVSVGKFQKRKNLDKVASLLDNYSKLKRLEIELNLVGETVESEKEYLDSLKQLKLKVSSKIRINIFENLDYDDLRDIYNRSDIFLLLAEHEVASVSQLEAFASGCAILAYFQNGNLDILPVNPLIQITHSLQEIETSLDIIINELRVKSSLKSYFEAYNDLFCGQNGATRILNVLD